MKRIFLFLYLPLVLVSCEQKCKQHDSVHVLSFRGTHHGDSAHSFSFYYADNTNYADGQEVVSISGLKSNREYEALAVLWNWHYGPIGGHAVNPEIECDAANHQVFFRISEGLDMSVAYEDKDRHGNPLGIRTTLSTGQPSTGTLTITLLHGPDKFAEGVSDGNITNAGGTVGLDCKFDVTIH